MGRILPLLGVVALAAAIAVTASNGATGRARPYSLAQVRHAFGAEGLRLSSSSLHVIVFRSERAAMGRTIEVVLGSWPHKKCSGCVVVRLSAPHGTAKPHVQETQVGNVVLAYLDSPERDSLVGAALSKLRS